MDYNGYNKKEVEARGSGVQDKPDLHKILSRKKTKKTEKGK